MKKLIDIMEEDDDVQNIWHNWEEWFNSLKYHYFQQNFELSQLFEQFLILCFTGCDIHHFLSLMKNPVFQLIA